jgi:hypothetical protein
MKQHKKFQTKKTLIAGFSALLLLGSFTLPLLPSGPKKTSAAPTVTITSPTEGQSISGTNFTAAGTATPNTTVVLSSGGISFAQTISDGSGNWSVATSLPAGNINLTARAIENPEYGYFATTSDFSTFNVNRLRISDNTVNPGGGAWPIDSNGTNPFIMVPSPVNNTYYSGNFLIPSTLPAKFNASLAVAPTTVTGSYPADPLANKGAFTQDGSLYFAPNMNAGNISVINTATNAWQQDLTVGSGDVVSTIWTAPSGLLYAPTFSGKIFVINPNTFATVNEINPGCTVAALAFSQDANYPFFFAPCVDSPQVKKIQLSDLSVVETWNTGIKTSSGIVALDNKKLYLIGTFAGDGSADSDKVKVLSTENGSTLNTIQLSGGSLGFLATSDFQKIYASTPGDPIGTQNIDVIDPLTDTVEASIPTDGFPGPLTTNPTQDAEATIQVAFVLGATTGTSSTAQKLAETGAIGISSTLLIGIIIAVTSYLYLDYRAHKKPLKAEDPHVKYTFLHHIRVVSMPRLKYRVAVTVSVSKRSSK